MAQYRFYSKKYREFVKLEPLNRFKYIVPDSTFHFLYVKYKEDDLLAYVSKETWDKFSHILEKECDLSQIKDEIHK